MRAGNAKKRGIEVKKRLLFIYNPNAGKARISTKLSDIIVILSQCGWETVVLPTEKRGDAAEFARRYAAEGTVERIVCSGGDGTLSEVVSGVLKSGCHVPVGFIPAGTTNDFGYSLKIPKDLIDAAWLAGTCGPAPSDVGIINGSTFTYTAAFGLFSDVSYDTPQNMKNVLGRAAYILSGAKSLTNVRAYQLEVEYCECKKDIIEDNIKTVLVEADSETSDSGMETILVESDREESADMIVEKVIGQANYSLGGFDHTVFLSEEDKTGMEMVLAEADSMETEATASQENRNKIKAVLEESDNDSAKTETITSVVSAENKTVLEKEQGVWKHAEGEFICGMISNSDSVGGFKGIMGKGVQFDDGVFEMVLIRRPHNLLELTDIINELLNKKLNSDNIVYSHVSAVKLKTAGELPWSLDGEYGGDMPQAEIHILKQAVEYIRDL